MSKKKIVLSFIMAVAMTLIFSVTTMAAGVAGLKANVENNTLKASWTALGDATQYLVTVTDITVPATPVVVVTDQVETDTDVAVAVSASKKYEVQVESDSVLSPDAVKVVVFAPASNGTLTSTDKDNNIGNANHTGTGATVQDGSKALGVDGVIKNPTDATKTIKNDGTTGTHRTHGEYQNNTNSCASCHQTHTGASKALLFKDGVYNTCTACHDGTLGMYNVFEHSNAGTFGGTAAGNMSVHMADGSVQIKAAPGGNLSANSGAWVNEFNCASCHSPHGSYSERLLHYNPNGMGLATKAEGGIGLKAATVVNFASIPAATSTSTPIVVRGTGTELGIAGLTTEKAITVMEVNQKPDKTWEWKTSSTPWLYGYVYGSPKNYYTRFFKIAEGSADWNLKVDGEYSNIIDNHDDDIVKLAYNKGYVAELVAGSGVLDSIVTANVGRAYTVDLDLQEFAKFGDANGVPVYKSNVNTLFDSNAVGYNKGQGVKMSGYCAACHTDYLAHSGTATGTFNSAYRHSTDSDSYTCVRCHFAHGTDAKIMLDAEGRDLATLTTDFGGDAVKAEAFLLDMNPSSALKRYTNMSVCWGCHTDSKAEQLKNTFSYGDGTGLNEDPHGLTAQPVKAGLIKDANLDGVIVNGN